MTLKPTDMLEIQSAIDKYERRFPRRPAPSAEVALAWLLGKRPAVTKRAPPASSDDRAQEVAGNPRSEFVQQECGRLMWAWEQFRLQWHMVRLPRFDLALSEDSGPWVKGVVRVGWWGMVALITASVFFFGAVIGGLK
jgi:hypothetical protein